MKCGVFFLENYLVKMYKSFKIIRFFSLRILFLKIDCKEMNEGDRFKDFSLKGFVNVIFYIMK